MSGFQVISIEFVSQKWTILSHVVIMAWRMISCGLIDLWTVITEWMATIVIIKMLSTMCLLLVC